MAQAKPIFTFLLVGSGSDATYIIDAKYGFTFFSIYNSSEVAGSYIGTVTAGEDSTSLPVAQYVTANITCGNNYAIDGVVITAPNGCTLELMGS